jgi:hypothetical protein
MPVRTTHLPIAKAFFTAYPPVRSGAYYLSREIISQAFPLGVIVGNGLAKLSLRRREKDDFHGYLIFSISANTASAEIAVISPQSKASIRSSAS